MKTFILKMCLIVLVTFPSQRAFSQAAEIEQLVLNIEKLAQFKQILSDMKKGYQILDGGYNAVKDIAQGNFSLHKAFLDGLLQVSPAVRNYRRVGEIFKYQVLLVKEYRAAYQRFSKGNHFNSQELGYMKNVYENLLKASLRNLNELSIVITAGQARMTDDERLQAIDRIHADMQDKVSFLRYFNNNTSVLAVQRAKEKIDVESARKINGIK